MDEKSESPSEELNSGSGSTTPNSSSTYEYSHEPFLTFQEKIVDLARQIGATGTIEVKRLGGGSYNRVIAATVRLESDSASPLTGVFRIPRFTITDGEDHTHADGVQASDRRILEQVTLSVLLTAHKISAPRILAFDATAANAIHSPYTFQEYVEGITLNDAYGTMSLDGKLNVVDDLVALLVQLESVKFTTAGRIGRAEHSTASRDLVPSRLNLLDHKRLGEAAGRFEIRGFGVGVGEDKDPTRPGRSLHEILVEQLDKWITYETKLLGDRAAFGTDKFQCLQKVVGEMKAMGFFEAETAVEEGADQPQNVLYHCDLEPRNILAVSSCESVEAGNDPKWKISAVLDWDEALCLPPVLARKPPVWLWDFSEDDAETNQSIPGDYDGDVDLLPADRYIESSGRLTEADQRIKAHFEESFVHQLSLKNPKMNMAVYQEQAYGRGQWLRRLHRFALDGFSDSQDLPRYERFLEEWHQFSSGAKRTSVERLSRLTVSA